jgi:hypothetical protein
MARTLEARSSRRCWIAARFRRHTRTRFSGEARGPHSRPLWVQRSLKRKMSKHDSLTSGPRRAFTGARSRGAATVEAVAVLPVFIVLLASVGYVQDRTLGKQTADMQARTCAWLHSAGGCGAPPPGCEAAIGLPVGDDQPVYDAQASDALAAGRHAITEHAGGGVVADIVHRIIRPALDLLWGRTAEAEVRRELRRPHRRASSKIVRGRYQLACNSRAVALGQVAEDAWNIFRPTR